MSSRLSPNDLEVLDTQLFRCARPSPNGGLTSASLQLMQTLMDDSMCHLARALPTKMLRQSSFRKSGVTRSTILGLSLAGSIHELLITTSSTLMQFFRTFLYLPRVRVGVAGFRI